MTRTKVVQIVEEFIIKYGFTGSCGVGKETKHGKYCIRVVLAPASHNVKLPSRYKGLKIVVIKGGEIRAL